MGEALYSVKGKPLPCNGFAVSVPLGSPTAAIIRLGSCEGIEEEYQANPQLGAASATCLRSSRLCQWIGVVAVRCERAGQFTIPIGLSPTSVSAHLKPGGGENNGNFRNGRLFVYFGRGSPYVSFYHLFFGNLCLIVLDFSHVSRSRSFKR